MKRNPLHRLSLLLMFLSVLSIAAESSEWKIPMGGNAYLTKSPDGGSDKVSPEGISRWENGDSVFSIFFRVDRPATLDLSLRMKVPEGFSVILAATEGKRFEISADSDDFKEYQLGKLTVNKTGYVRVDLKGSSKEGPSFANVSDLLVESQSDGLVLNYVKDNEDNRFYWGRRGASVHLQYQMPKGIDCEYFYNEVTVPEGGDPIGTYAMANGFGEGYFGMQVNGPEQRRILFSVWSPFRTDDPKSIPEDQRIKLLAKGKDVHTGEFGNEGSGGQSYLVFPWKTGSTYRFLNRARPDGNGNTIYTAWFHAPGEKEWKLIASFSRPKTDKHLTRFHSFLENFRDTHGYFERRANFQNQWVRDTNGKWHPIPSAKLTGDTSARREDRLDFAGGTDQEAFFLKNGGFFAVPVKLGTSFDRPVGSDNPPDIKFETLDSID